MAHSLLVWIDTESQTKTVAEFLGATYTDMDVTLLNVIRYTEKSTSPSRGGRKKPDGWYEDAREEAERLFDLARDYLGESANTIETVVESGDPAAEILARADEDDVDQIAIGFEKRNPTGKLVFGSTAQDVLLSTTRPVLAVPLEL